MTHARVIPCVKTNDILRISSEKWYLKNFIEKMLNRFNFENEETKRRFNEIQKLADKYIEQKLK